MEILTLEITLRASWCTSLKDKRSEVKSLLAKLRNNFNVSAAEIARRDNHQIIVIGIAAISADSAQADRLTGHVVGFVEANTEALITDIVRDRR